MTVQENISEAGLDHRSRDLQAELDAARERLRDASKRAAFEEITPEELRPYREEVENLEAKQSGIEAARKDIERARIVAENDRKAAVRRKAVQAGRKIVANMADERSQIDELLGKLTPHLLRIRQLQEDLRTTVAPHVSATGRFHVGSFSYRNNEFIEGAVYRCGLSHWGMGTARKPGGPAWAVSPKPSEEHDSLASLIEQDKAEMERAVEQILSEKEGV